MSSCYHNASHSVSHRLLCWCSWRLSCLPRHVSHTFKFHQISPNLSKKHHVKYLPHPFMPVFEVLTAHTWETQKKSAHYAVIKNDASAAGVSVFAFGLTNVVQKQLWTPWSSTVSPDLLPKDFWGFWPRSAHSCSQSAWYAHQCDYKHGLTSSYIMVKLSCLVWSVYCTTTVKPSSQNSVEMWKSFLFTKFSHETFLLAITMHHTAFHIASFTRAAGVSVAFPNTFHIRSKFIKIHHTCPRNTMSSIWHISMWDSKHGAHYAVLEKVDALAGGVSVLAFGATTVVQKQQELWRPWSSTASHDLPTQGFLNVLTKIHQENGSLLLLHNKRTVELPNS